MSLSNVVRVLVPRRWTGEQALAVIRILREVTDAIWTVHGEAMINEMVDPNDPFTPLDLPPDIHIRDEIDDIPF